MVDGLCSPKSVASAGADCFSQNDESSIVLSSCKLHSSGHGATLQGMLEKSPWLTEQYYEADDVIPHPPRVLNPSHLHGCQPKSPGPISTIPRQKLCCLGHQHRMWEEGETFGRLPFLPHLGIAPPRYLYNLVNFSNGGQEKKTNTFNFLAICFIAIQQS